MLPLSVILICVCLWNTYKEMYGTITVVLIIKYCLLYNIEKTTLNTYRKDLYE